MSKQFQLASMFNGYKMHFLNNPVTYKLKDEVELKRSKFSMKVFLSSDDSYLINLILSRLHPELKIVNTYMSTTKTRFLDTKLTLIEFDEEIKWRLSITIRGYKADDKGVLTPIWSIDEAISC